MSLANLCLYILRRRVKFDLSAATAAKMFPARANFRRGYVRNLLFRVLKRGKKQWTIYRLASHDISRSAADRNFH